MEKSHVPVGWERTWQSKCTQLRHTLWLADHAAVCCKPWGEITAVVVLLEQLLPYDYPPPQLVHISQWDGRAVEDETLRQFLREMERFEKAGDVVLLHCQMGISRTPAFAIFWLMYKTLSEMTDYKEFSLIPRLGLATLWSVFEDEIKAKRPWTMPHNELKQSMLKFFEREVLKIGTVA